MGNDPNLSLIFTFSEFGFSTVKEKKKLFTPDGQMHLQDQHTGRLIHISFVVPLNPEILLELLLLLDFPPSVLPSWDGTSDAQPSL